MGSFLLNVLSKILVAIFLIGLVGSAVVVVITFFEDGQLLLERDEPKVKEQEDVAPPARAQAREAF